MSNSAYDIFLDTELENYYADIEDIDLHWPDEPAIEPNNDLYYWEEEN